MKIACKFNNSGITTQNETLKPNKESSGLKAFLKIILRNIFSKNFEKTSKKISVTKSYLAKNDWATDVSLDQQVCGIPVKKAYRQTCTCSKSTIKILK